MICVLLHSHKSTRVANPPLHVSCPRLQTPSSALSSLQSPSQLQTCPQLTPATTPSYLRLQPSPRSSCQAARPRSADPLTSLRAGQSLLSSLPSFPPPARPVIHFTCSADRDLPPSLSLFPRTPSLPVLFPVSLPIRSLAMSEPIPQLNFPRHRANPFSNVDLPTKKPQVTQGNIYTRQQSSGSGKPRQPGQSGQPGQSAPTSNRTGSCATTHRPPGAFGSPSKLKDTKSSLRPQHEQPGSTLSTPNRPQGATTATVPPQQSTGSHHAPEERSSVSRSKSMKGGTGNGGGAGNDGGAGFKQDPDALDVAASGNATGNRQASFQSQSSSFQNSFQKPSTGTSAPATAQPSNSINSMAYSDPAPPQDSHPDPGRQPSQHAHSHSSRPTSDRYYEYPAVDPRTKEEVAHHDARQAALFSSDEIPQAASERKRSNVPPPAGHPGPIQSQTASDVFGQVGPGQTLPQQYSYDPPASHAQRDVKPFPDSSYHNQSSYPETNVRTQGAHQLAQPQLPAYAPHHPRPVAASEHLAIKQERHSDTSLLPTERERSSSLSVSYHGQNWVGALGDPAEETTPMWKAMQIQEQHFQKQINKLVSFSPSTIYVLPTLAVAVNGQDDREVLTRAQAMEKDQLRVELNRKEEASAHTADQLQESRIKNLSLEKKFDEANRAKEDMGVRARKTLDTMKRQ